MPSVRLTATGIDKLPVEQGKQVVYFDTKVTGFGVRVSGRTKAYFVKVRCNTLMKDGERVVIKETLGKVREDEHGNVDATHYEEMLSRAKAIIDDAGKDITPAMRQAEEKSRLYALEQARKIEESKDLTLGTLFKRYLAMKAAKGKLKDSTAGQYRMSMDTHFSDWMDKPARQITSSMIEQRHIEIGTVKTPTTYITAKGGNRKGRTGGKGAADLAMRVLRAVFSYGVAVYEDTFTRNPVAVLSKTDNWFKLERRESFIESTQLKAWFEAVNSLDIEGTKTMLILGMFTGARKGELASLKWSDVDLENGTVLFRITKNGKLLFVPLAGFVVNVLKEYQEKLYSGEDGYVFPSHGKSGHLKDPRGAKARITEQSGVNFMMHDFRRGFLTYANAVEIPVWTQKRLVNHALPTDVTHGYVQFEIPVLRQAVEAIAVYILSNAGLFVPPSAEVNTEEQTEQPQQPEPKQAHGNVISLDDHRLLRAA